MIIALGVIVLGGVGLFLLQNQAPNSLPSSSQADIQQALASVPPSDTPGKDLPGVPRPPGSVRSFYIDRGQVATAIYVQHEEVPAVQQAMVAALTAGPWRPVGREGTPDPAGNQVTPRVWQGVFSNGNAILQVEILRGRDVTGTTLILQTPR
ncbi:MAG: hypothetical protein M3O87_03385 [Candidatus Dormibacteraeota bacterium]|nr:hypothetical protein [Candidatus Dormibacteraeota bacterium]